MNREELYKINLQYKKYPFFINYAAVLADRANIRTAPDPAAPVIKTASFGDKFNLLGKVTGKPVANSSVWYKIAPDQKPGTSAGYIHSSVSAARTFRFKNMVSLAQSLKSKVDGADTAFINNYKNINGMPPAINGKNEDKYGELRDQSAPAYTSPDLNSEMRYIPDGSLVNIIGYNGNFTKVNYIKYNTELFVPNRYIDSSNKLEELTQVIVVDIANQNIAALDYSGGIWTVVSATYATTGANTGKKLPTVPGDYKVIGKYPKFNYLSDITGKISGYGPYALRFNGGAYIHGVPVNYKKNSKGELIDPGLVEQAAYLGTIPLSHKCVRNYTSHAKFLYDRTVLNKSAIIVF